MNAAPVAVGDVIGGRYRIEAMLGQGGMAVVYRAQHTGTGKPCALKLVHPNLVTRRELVDLFIREAQVGSRIGQNPHIIDVFDAGADEQRRVPFLAMELLQGETLEDYLEKRGPMPHALIRTVLVQLADALDQAHQAGVVHRDLKPSNLFLTQSRKGEPLLKVMDFGIAKVLEQEAQRTATQIGTPSYAAPEQMGPTLRRLAERQGIILAAGVSPGTDIWAMGLLVFELFTALPTGHYWGVESLAELPAKVALEEAEPASVRAGDRANLLPPGFDTWLARCTRKNSVERWPSAGEAVRALLSLMDQAGPAAGAIGIQQTAFGAPLGASSGPFPGSTPAPGPGEARAPLPSFDMPALDSTGGRRAQTPPGTNASGLGATELPGGPIVGTNPPFPATSPSPGAQPWNATPPGPAPWGAATPAPPAYGAPYGQPSYTPAGYMPPGVGATAGPGPAGGKKSIIGIVAGIGGGLLLLFVISGVIGYRLIRQAGARAECTTGGHRCEEACDDGHTPSCLRLASTLETGRDGAVKDEAKAADLYEQACKSHDQKGCTGLGRMIQGGRGGRKQDLPAALAMFKEACEAGEPAGCTMLGEDYELGQGGVGKDATRALGLYTKACDGGDLRGCKDLGWMHEIGGGGLPKNEARAVSYYQQACDGGELTGCTNLGVMQDSGRGGLLKDDLKAVALYQKACDGGEMRGCKNLGWMYETGRGVAKSESEAARLYDKACDAGDMLACNNLGVMCEAGRGGLQKDEIRANALYKKACDNGDMLGCNNIGVMYETGRGGLPKSDKSAVEFYQKACDGGDMHGCRNLGVMFEAGRGVPHDEARAVALYRKACDANDMRACVSLGWMYEMGHGGLVKDERKAVDLYRSGCEGGDALGCNNFGVMNEAGRGGLPKDEARAAELYDRACSGGSVNACSSLGWFLFQGKVVPQDKNRGIELLRKGCRGGNSWGCDRLRDAGG
ncbi:MAG: protein kinase [Byssovorax sp.]